VLAFFQTPAKQAHDDPRCR